jgi:hypothetical protein
MRVSLPLRRGSSWLAALLLGACGGGVHIGFGFGDGFDDRAPAVQLTSASTSVPAGQPVQLAAAASDENGIEHVSFFRLDGVGEVFLGRDDSAPYQINVLAPTDGRAALTVFARATDRAGNTADSAAVTIAITP